MVRVFDVVQFAGPVRGSDLWALKYKYGNRRDNFDVTWWIISIGQLKMIIGYSNVQSPPIGENFRTACCPFHFPLVYEALELLTASNAREFHKSRSLKGMEKFRFTVR